MAQALGAALSPAIGGWIGEELGHHTMFLLLGALGAGSLAL
jgi:hypothetical protein